TTGTQFTYDLHAILADVCPGDLVTIYGLPYGPGTYTDTITGVGPECDTIVTINVNQLPYETNTINADVCPGDLVTIYGIPFGPGTYTDTITGVGPECDTIETGRATRRDCELNTINADVCPGDLVTIYGLPYGPGTYRDTIAGVGHECDTIVTINVNQLPYELNTINADVCPGDLVTIYGLPYGPGTYTDTITGVGPECDTIVTINVNQLPYELNTINADVCPGDLVTIYGLPYGPGTYTHTTTLLAPERDAF